MTTRQYLTQEANAKIYSVKIDTSRSGAQAYYRLFVVNRANQIVDITESIAELLKIRLLHPLGGLIWDGSPRGLRDLYDTLQGIVGENYILTLINF